MSLNSRIEKRVLLIVGVDGIGPTRLPSLFYKAGCRVILFAPARFAVARSRYVDRHIAVPEDPDAFVHKLRLHLESFQDEYDWIQIGDEVSLRWISKHQGQSWADGCLPVGHGMDLLLNKLEFFRVALDEGLPVPDTRFATSDDELTTCMAEIGFPLYLKHGESMSGSGVMYLDSHEAFQACSQWDFSGNTTIAVQEAIDGYPGSTEVLYDQGKPIAWISSYHREHCPVPLSASCVRELVVIPEMKVLLEQIGELTGFNGLAGVDWIVDANSEQLYLIELNPRPTPCYHLGAICGVDFSEGFRNLLMGKVSIQSPRSPDPRHAIVYQFPQYCYWTLDSHLYHRLVVVIADIPRHDPLLVLALVRRVITHYLPKQLRSCLRPGSPV